VSQRRTLRQVRPISSPERASASSGVSGSAELLSTCRANPPLREQIESGALEAGLRHHHPAPTGAWASHADGGKASRLLVDDGLVVRVPGLGYYVAE
jgi:hypothetical protein